VNTSWRRRGLTMPNISKTLFRSLLRKVRPLSAQQCQLLLREPMDVTQWGQGRFVQDSPDIVLSKVFDFELPEPTLEILTGRLESDDEANADVADAPLRSPRSAAENGEDPDSHADKATTSAPSGLLSSEEVVAAIRAAARFYQRRCELGAIEEPTVVRNAFSALRAIGPLVSESLNTKVMCTSSHGAAIRVEVTTQQVVKSQAEYNQNSKHVFCYRVRVSNLASTPNKVSSWVMSGRITFVRHFRFE